MWRLPTYYILKCRRCCRGFLSVWLNMPFKAYSL
ncbi:MAG: hypothetical protein J6S13_06160 [Clostridia bacterium]|nr:hypothetical protein [Clostridia bacterium]